MMTNGFWILFGMISYPNNPTYSFTLLLSYCNLCIPILAFVGTEYLSIPHIFLPLLFFCHPPTFSLAFSYRIGQPSFSFQYFQKPEHLLNFLFSLAGSANNYKHFPSSEVLKYLSFRLSLSSETPKSVILEVLPFLNF